MSRLDGLATFKWQLLVVFAVCLSGAAYVNSLPVDAFTDDPDQISYQISKGRYSKWERLGETDNFSEYVDVDRVEEVKHGVFNIVIMRSYSQSQKAVDEGVYFSKVIEEQINCHKRTIANKRETFYTSKYAKGRVAKGPFDMRGNAFEVSKKSIGARKIDFICEDLFSGSQYI